MPARALPRAGWTGSKATSGSTSTGALTSATDFTLTCTGTGGSASVTAHVALVPRPTLSLAANPTTINRGSDIDSDLEQHQCNDLLRQRRLVRNQGDVRNYESTAALQATTSFTMTCTGAAGTATQNVTVAINSADAHSHGYSDFRSRRAEHLTVLDDDQCQQLHGFRCIGRGARAVNDSDTSGAIVIGQYVHP